MFEHHVEGGDVAMIADFILDVARLFTFDVHVDITSTNITYMI
jgi:hypothetical protein